MIIHLQLKNFMVAGVFPRLLWTFIGKLRMGILPVVAIDLAPRKKRKRNTDETEIGS
jgi:hypothetical protein